MKSSCGKWETPVKKRVISESDNPAALSGDSALLLVQVPQIKHGGCVDEQMSQICGSKTLGKTGLDSNVSG